MPRTFRGPDLTLWDVYANPARGGSAHSAQVVFLPREANGAPGLARGVAVEGSRSEAEGMLEELGLAELRDLLARAVLLT
jgi:hypothetical protein